MKTTITKHSHSSTSTVHKKAGRLWNGPGTHEIHAELFATNRERLIERLRPKVKGNAVVILQGGDETPLYDVYTPYNIFQQESFFMWTFGVIEPGCYGAIDLEGRTSYLFVPRMTSWRTVQLTTHDYAKKYEIENVHYVDELPVTFKSLNPSVLLTLRGVNSDSLLVSKEARFEGIEKFHVNNSILYNEMADLRVYKNEMEIDVMKYVLDVTCEAHRDVMRFAKAGNTEYQCEAEFLHYIYAEGGCRHPSFPCICSSGANSAYLEYGNVYTPHDKIIEPGDLVLCNMGAKYFGYCADVTTTFPVNGTFTPNQKLIYESVLTTMLTVTKALRPGISFLDLHQMAQKTLLSELKKAGLLKGDVEAMTSAGLGAIFQPHGLGHFIGLDAHDVGGFINAKRSEVKWCEALRTTRVLEEKMVIVLEPGCYFIESLLEQASQNSSMNRFLVPELIKKFRKFGGVRIGDVFHITRTGAHCLSRGPRTVKEVEDWLMGKDDDKYK